MLKILGHSLFTQAPYTTLSKLGFRVDRTVSNTRRRLQEVDRNTRPAGFQELLVLASHGMPRLFPVTSRLALSGSFCD